MTVAILCTARRSVYHTLPDVEVYDRLRDARTFAGGMPVVAHPPCGGWSHYLRHSAKPGPGEMELGVFCAERLRECGGVLEQPAFSHLWDAAGLPIPPHRSGDLVSAEVWQVWWGHRIRKATWLCFCGLDPAAIEMPFRLHARGRDKQVFRSYRSAAQRSATPPEFAVWLVAAARLARKAIPAT
jgi:hypothetical protein